MASRAAANQSLMSGINASPGTRDVVSHATEYSTHYSSVIAVAINAAKINKCAVEWALANVVQPGDLLILLALWPARSLLWSIPSLLLSAGDCTPRLLLRSTSTNRKISARLQEIKNSADEISGCCESMISELQSLCDAKMVEVRIKVLPADGEKGAAAMACERMGAKWVVLDRHVTKREGKICLEQLSCNVVVVKQPTNSKILRLNLRSISQRCNPVGKYVHDSGSETIREVNQYSKHLASNPTLMVEPAEDEPQQTTVCDDNMRMHINYGGGVDIDGIIDPMAKSINPTLHFDAASLFPISPVTSDCGSRYIDTHVIQNDIPVNDDEADIINMFREKKVKPVVPLTFGNSGRKESVEDESAASVLNTSGTADYLSISGSSYPRATYSSSPSPSPGTDQLQKKKIDLPSPRMKNQQQKTKKINSSTSPSLLRCSSRYSHAAAKPINSSSTTPSPLQQYVNHSHGSPAAASNASTSSGTRDNCYDFYCRSILSTPMISESMQSVDGDHSPAACYLDKRSSRICRPNYAIMNSGGGRSKSFRNSSTLNDVVNNMGSFCKPSRSIGSSNIMCRSASDTSGAVIISRLYSAALHNRSSCNGCSIDDVDNNFHQTSPLAAAATLRRRTTDIGSCSSRRLRSVAPDIIHGSSVSLSPLAGNISRRHGVCTAAELVQRLSEWDQQSTFSNDNYNATKSEKSPASEVRAVAQLQKKKMMRKAGGDVLQRQGDDGCVAACYSDDGSAAADCRNGNTSAAGLLQQLRGKVPPSAEAPPLCSICRNKAPEFGSPVRRFTYRELEMATGGFSPANFLAEGGFGSVHRGVLPDGQAVAVKQHKAAASGGSAQAESAFRSEVEVLSCAQHRNVVMLIGYCTEQRRRLLVYEFVCNGSLDAHLYGAGCGNGALPWGARRKVAVGAARGLRYLHEECRVGCIVHRDLRPNNILLTHDYEPMVGDFGLARWQPDGDLGVQTRVIGTFGYLAPEYAQSGEISEKADVFSYGVVLLELVTGRKAVDMSRPKGEQCLTEWARPLLQEFQFSGDIDRRLMELVDPRLDGNYSRQELRRSLHAASLCIHKDPRIRPRMSQILRILEGDVIIDTIIEGSVPPPYNYIQMNQRPRRRRPAMASSQSARRSSDEQIRHGDDSARHSFAN